MESIVLNHGFKELKQVSMNYYIGREVDLLLCVFAESLRVLSDDGQYLKDSSYTWGYIKEAFT